MRRFCYALDLKENDELIAEYEHWHKEENSWPEIKKSIIDAHILSLDIFRTGNRLFMIVVADDNFCAEQKAALDAANPKVQEWEELMWKFQQPLPWAKEGEKWVLMKQIFQLEKKT